MTEENILPSEVPFVTVIQASVEIAKAISSAVNSQLFAYGTIATPAGNAVEEWRIGVFIRVPRFFSSIGRALARWRVPGFTRHIEFVLKAQSDAVTIGSQNQPRRRAHEYTVLNGSFQREHHLSTEIKRARPFRDAYTRSWYGTTFETTDFERAMAVIQSEITGQPAFPERIRDDGRY